jgi:hypothetical protein
MAEVDEATGASALNRELTRLLLLVGEQMGFEARAEYPLAGARLDVVWLWSPPTTIPGLEHPLVVAAFEIESSWRTRKHVKGDLINLQDVGPALGVIVLAGADPRDDSLRRFATNLVDRPGPRILIWTDADVRALAAGDESVSAFAEAAAGVAAHPVAAPVSQEDVYGGSALIVHSGKYVALWLWLSEQPKAEIPMSFADVERILGFDLPPSCRQHEAHWYSYQGSAVARAIIDAGWHASRAKPELETLVFVPGPPAARA